MHYIFLYSRRSNDTLKKKYLGPLLCQTAFHFHSPGPCKALDKLTQYKCFWIHLWPVSSKYSANIKSGPKTPLNKHNETPTASLCVLLLTYSGMFLCLWITNNKLQNICSERLNNCFSNSQPTEYFHIGFLWQRFRFLVTSEFSLQTSCIFVVFIIFCRG